VEKVGLEMWWGKTHVLTNQLGERLLLLLLLLLLHMDPIGPAIYYYYYYYYYYHRCSHFGSSR
jgi:hypothetical protein